MPQLCQYQNGTVTVLAELPESVRGLDYSRFLNGVLITDSTGLIQLFTVKNGLEPWLQVESGVNAICAVGQRAYFENQKHLVLSCNLPARLARPLLGQRSKQMLHTFRANGKAGIDRCGGLCIGPNDHPLLADAERNRVLIVGTHSLISNFIGSGKVGFSVAIRPEVCLLNRPCGIVSDGTKIYLADTGNNCLRILAANGAPLAVVGTPTKPGLVDGAIPSFEAPADLTIWNNELYVVDGHRLRRYANQTVSTVFIREQRIQAISGGAAALYFIDV